MASATIDYEALAKQHGAVSSTPPAIDYNAIAKQHGAVSSTPPAGPVPAAQKTVSVPMTNYPIDPKTGQRTQQPQAVTPQGLDNPISGTAQAALSPLGAFSGAMEQAGRGLHRVTHPESASDFAGGLSDTIRGAGTIALPFLAPELLAHPFRAAAGVIFGSGAQQATEKGLQAVGVPEGYSHLAGDVVGGAAGGAASQAERGAVGVGKKLLPKLKSTLNPVEQSAVDYARGEGKIRLSPGTISGNKGVQNLEAVTQASPLGAQTGAEFRRGTEADLQGAAGRLSDQAHEKPTTPESVGRAIPAKMDERIADLSKPRDEAYERAWQGRDDPEHTYHMPVGMREVAVLDEKGKPTGEVEQRPVMKKVNMPVDIRDLKEQAAPIYDSMKWRLAPAEQNASAGFNALEKILKSDDFIPAWQAEDGLSALKSMARMEPSEGVRDRSQGIGAHLVPELQSRIDDAVANTGEDAIQGLQQGRQLHSQIMDVEDVASKLRDKEPVRNFGRLVTAKDTGVDFLRKVQNLAPEQMEPLGRAWVQQQMDRATREGGFSKTQGLLNDWRDMGPQTKQILFPDAKVREGLGNLFKVADMASHAPNPSGTALVQSATSINPLRIAAGYLGSKLFFTPEGIGLLTDAVKPQGAGSSALKWAQVRAKGGPPPEEPPPAGPGSGPAPQPPGPGTTGRAALQGALDRQGSIPAAAGPTNLAPRPAAPPAGRPAIAPEIPTASPGVSKGSGGGLAVLEDAVGRQGAKVAASKAKLQPGTRSGGQVVQGISPEAPAVKETGQNFTQPVVEQPQSGPRKGEPGWMGKMDPRELTVDAPRFQFKADVGQAGVSDKLKDARTYDPEMGGTLAAWKDPADGKSYVVNGHHRRDLAIRLDAPEVGVQYLRAKTAQEARLKGAIINIGEDQGSSIDAAKVFRDSGKTPEELAAGGLQLKGKIASEGLALSKLDPGIFKDVVAGDLKPARGAVLGALERPADQKAVYDLMKKQEASGRRMTDDQVAELIRMNDRAPTVTESSADDAQGGLFGVEEMQRSLLPEKAIVSDYVRDQLKTEKKLFGIVGKQSAAEKLGSTGNVIKTGANQAASEEANQGMVLYDKLSVHSGQIDDILNEAARSLADGESSAQVKQRTYRLIRDQLTGQVKRLTH